MSKTLVLDLNNFGHRCRAGFTDGKNAFIFKFVRNLRSLVEKHKPDSMVFVKEGSPKHRYEIYKEYKGHRKIKEDDPELQEKFSKLMEFKNELEEAVKFALKDLEVTVIRHAELEADDLIANYAHFLVEQGEEVVVVSNDKDFAQLVYQDERIKVWDPGKKDFVEKPQHDPVMLKVLSGDKSDNIGGISGYGPKKAQLLCQAIAEGKFSISDFSQEQRETYERNMKLVNFYKMTEQDWSRVESISGRWDAGALIVDFTYYEFGSLLKDSVLYKYYDTFGNMKRAKLPRNVR